MSTSTTDISQHSMSKLRLSHGAKRSQHHAKALLRHICDTRLPPSCTRCSADTPEPIHHTKALHELRSDPCAMHCGTHERSRNHVVEVALARACDRWHTQVSSVCERSSSRQACACADSCWAVGCNRKCKRPGMRVCDRRFLAGWHGMGGCTRKDEVEVENAHERSRPPSHDRTSLLLPVTKARFDWGAAGGASLYEHIWAQRCARIRMILPAGRTGSWRCSELLADLLSGQPGHCGRRGPYFTTRWRCRALEWGASPGRAMVLLD